MDVQLALVTLARDGAWVLTCTRCNVPHDAQTTLGPVVALFATQADALAEASATADQPLDDLQVAHIGPADLPDAVAHLSACGYGLVLTDGQGQVAIERDHVPEVFPGGSPAAPTLAVRRSVLAALHS